MFAIEATYFFFLVEAADICLTEATNVCLAEVTDV